MAKNLPTQPDWVPTVVAAAALASARFVNIAGNYAGAGGYALGVTASPAAAAGDLIPVVACETAEVECGAAFAVGTLLMSDATGRAVTWTSGNTAVARAMTASTGAGDFVEARLIPC